MYVYKISDLLKSLKSAQRDGFEYVSISVLPAEDDMEESIDLEYIEDADSSAVDSIDTVILPENYICNLKY